MKRSLLLTVTTILFLMFLGPNGNAQTIGINNDGSTPDNSAMLDVKNPNKGLLIPRVALTGTDDATTIPSPATSLLVYNTTAAGSGGTAVTPAYYYWNGSSWVQLATGSIAGTAWLLTGNTGTVDATNFIGTTDNVPFNIRVNNTMAGRLDPVLLNAFWGVSAGNTTTTGQTNTGIGFQALLSNTSGGSNTVTGCFAMQFNNTGSLNTATGRSALFRNTTGSTNSAYGTQSLLNNTTGFSNVAVGDHALNTNTTASNLVAVGDSVLRRNTGVQNTAVGSKALQLNTTGSNNTANGYQALLNNTVASNNVASGDSALVRNTTGFSNTAVGYRALQTNTTGTNNTAIGDSADVTATNLTNATAIGNKATVAASNTVQIGNSSVTDVYFGNGTSTVLHGTVSANAFADFYALMPSDNASTVAPGISIQFPQNGPANGISRATSSTFTLPATGTYELNFQVSIVEAGQLVVVMNGTELPYTVVGRTTGTTQITGTCLISATAGAIISINNPAGNSNALTIAPLAGGSQPVSAHLVIKRLN